MVPKNIIKELEQIKQMAIDEFKNIEFKAQNRVKHLAKLKAIHQQYLGRHGKLSKIFKEIAVLDTSAKKEAGTFANKIKQDLTKELSSLAKANSYDMVSFFDETIPGLAVRCGSIHPITQILDKIIAVFTSMGFEVVEDREVETAEYNFDKLNIPAYHPSRDMWDTFYIKVKSQKSKVKSKEWAIRYSPLVLRTHTSSVQLRAMETRKPPVRLIVPGRVYRHEATDASHETTFYQLEGLVIDKDISASNMIHILDDVLKNLFGLDVKIRIRPSFFPFVEPGFEVDMSCIICKSAESANCSVCSSTGWLEMLGSGMVHPAVLKNMDVDPETYSGFAFGMGIDRIMMLYYGVPDIRLSYSGDLRFLRQF